MAVFYDAPLQSAVSTLNAKSSGIDLRGDVDQVTIYIVSGAGVASGAVTIEEADDPDYAGTWSSIQVVTVPPASTQTAVHLPGTYKAIRTRISTIVAGGTISTRMTAHTSGGY